MTTFTLFIKDTFGNVICDKYASYEIAYCVMASRLRNVNPFHIAVCWIRDDETGELVWYRHPLEKEPDHYFTVAWAEDDEPFNNCDLVVFLDEQKATESYNNAREKFPNIVILETKYGHIESYDYEGSEKWHDHWKILMD